jgi:hypothetical protein
MPQVYIVLGPGTLGLFAEDEVSALGERLMPVVEKGFGIQKEKDAAFTAVRAVATSGEADVQVEIRYTAGRDEYGRGRPFNPSLKVQKKLAGLIEKEFRAFLKDRGLRAYSLSVWCQPHFGGFFKMCKE